MKMRAERGKTMNDAAADLAKDWLTLGLAGLGITFAPAHEYLGGLFLGLSGAGFAAHLAPEKARIELWAAMLGGFLVSHLAAIAAHVWLPALPIQLVMAAAGFGSRFVARFALRALGIIEGKADRVVDGVIDRVLPLSGKAGDDENR